MSINNIEFKSKVPNPQVPGVYDVSAEEVHSQLQELLIIDVRRPDEWVGEFGHIGSAQHIILDTLPMRIHELPKDKTIVFVCRSGARSAQASAFARENGFNNTYNMTGGMMAWTAKNFSVVDRK